MRPGPRDEMNDMYNRADAFVMTSIQEGQPVSALEAACCGLPVFSTRCGGVEDYVGDDIGMIFDIADSEGMAQGLKCFLEGKKKYDSVVIRSKTIQRFGREGEEDRTFEKAFAEYCGTKYCIGVGNGLDALILILKSLGIGAGDEVIVPSNTFIATALAVTSVGARPIFVEPDIRTFTIDPNFVTGYSIWKGKYLRKK